MRFKSFHLTYYRQIQGSFLIFVIIPMIIVMCISYVIIQKQVREKIKLSNESVITLIGKDISKMLDEVTIMSDFYVQDESVRQQLSEFKDVVQLNSYSDYETYSEIRSFFGTVALKAMDPNLFLYLVNNEEFIIQPSMREDIPPPNIKKEWSIAKERVDVSKEMLLQKLGVIGRQDTLERKYYMARVIDDRDTGETLAILYISISSTYFEQLFDQVEASHMVIYDENNQFMAGNEQIGYLSETSENSSFRTEYVIDKTGWKMIYGTPPGEIMGQMMKMLLITLALIIPCFILFIWIAIVMARRLHRPILQLQNGIKQFSNGNRNVAFQVEGPQELIQFGHALNTMVDQINELISNIEKEQEEKRRLELQALFSQIRPHFLLNTINSIRFNLVLHDDEYHSQKLASLMSLLRAHMTLDDTNDLTHEGRLLENYVDIMNMRNDMQLSFYIKISDEVANVHIPKLILQPLVENAFVHGFTNVHSEPAITLSAWRQDQQCFIKIEDNGEGITAKRLDELRLMLNSTDEVNVTSYDRIGLHNILRRLQMIYGTTTSIQLMNNDLGGASVLINIPYKEM